MSDLPNPVPGQGDTPKSQYEKFLMAEYDNIAAAHFDTGTTITRFFQFYLLILTTPLTLAGLLVKIRGDSFDLVQIVDSTIAPWLALLLGLIALVGLGMMGYVTNVRLDFLLYARVINGIRKYFYERSGVDLDQEMWVRALPRAIH